MRLFRTSSQEGQLLCYLCTSFFVLKTFYPSVTFTWGSLFQMHAPEAQWEKPFSGILLSYMSCSYCNIFSHSTFVVIAKKCPYLRLPVPLLNSGMDSKVVTMATVTSLKAEKTGHQVKSLILSVYKCHASGMTSQRSVWIWSRITSGTRYSTAGNLVVNCCQLFSESAQRGQPSENHRPNTAVVSPYSGKTPTDVTDTFSPLQRPVIVCSKKLNKRNTHTSHPHIPFSFYFSLL